jgi:hypothetical protein
MATPLNAPELVSRCSISSVWSVPPLLNRSKDQKRQMSNSLLEAASKSRVADAKPIYKGWALKNILVFEPPYSRMAALMQSGAYSRHNG